MTTKKQRKSAPGIGSSLRKLGVLLLWSLSVAYSFFVFAPLLGSTPDTFMAWLGLGIAVLVPQTLVLWLRRHASLDRLFALNAGWIGAITATFMLFFADLSSFIPCRPMIAMAEALRGIWSQTWSQAWLMVLAFQALVGVTGLAYGLRPSRRRLDEAMEDVPIRARALGPAAILLLCQATALALVVAPAFLGYPTFTRVHRGIFALDTETRSDPTEILIDYLDRTETPQRWSTSMIFDLGRSRTPEYFAISVQLDGATGGRLVAMRSRAATSPEHPWGEDIPTLHTEITDKTLSPRQARKLDRLLGQLWQIEPASLAGGGLDGSIWAFDGRRGRDIRRLEAWCPGDADYHDDPRTAPDFARVNETGRYLLELSGYAVCERELY